MATDKTPPPSTYRILANRWGRIKRLRTYWEPLIVKRGAVTEEIAHGTKFWSLKCDCGYEWDIAENDFPGRRALRSCGRPGCEFSKPSKAVRSEGRKAVFSLYLPIDVADYIRLYGQRKNLSMSRALTDMVYNFQASELINED